MSVFEQSAARSVKTPSFKCCAFLLRGTFLRTPSPTYSNNFLLLRHTHRWANHPHESGWAPAFRSRPVVSPGPRFALDDWSLPVSFESRCQWGPRALGLPTRGHPLGTAMNPRPHLSLVRDALTTIYNQHGARPARPFGPPWAGPSVGTTPRFERAPSRSVACFAAFRRKRSSAFARANAHRVDRAGQFVTGWRFTQVPV